MKIVDIVDVKWTLLSLKADCCAVVQVPLTVSNLDFWSRYYFRCRQLDDEEARRVELMRRADEVQGEKEMGWDEGQLHSCSLCHSGWIALTNHTHNTHTHNRFTALLGFVRDYPGEQVRER